MPTHRETILFDPKYRDRRGPEASNHGQLIPDAEIHTPTVHPHRLRDRDLDRVPAAKAND
ncbi:hypothetical protein [Nocardia altamirensis]|uniref:hypothetical protein n=1 Tax=Nocardia altamirensis TaxID=472158 RepID=UPI00083FFDEE|nr:hypothetical protein [Nocardia altamirensis]